jgi:protein-S-isoprenylcysteine O-methyltransferase Ste14
MKKKLKAAFYTFLVLLVFGLLLISEKTYPYETMMIIVILVLCVIVYALYVAILNLID